MEVVKSIEVYKNLSLKGNHCGLFMIGNEIFILTNFFSFNDSKVKTVIYIYNIETDKEEKHVIDISFLAYCNIGNTLYIYDGGYEIMTIKIEDIKNRKYVFTKSIAKVIQNKGREIKRLAIDIIEINGEPYYMIILGNNFEVFSLEDFETYFEYEYECEIEYIASLKLDNKIILLPHKSISYIEIDLINKTTHTIFFPDELKNFNSFVHNIGNDILFKIGEDLYMYNCNTKGHFKVSFDLPHDTNVKFFVKHKSNYYYHVNNTLYTDIKYHISHDLNDDDEKCVIFYSKELGGSNEAIKIPLSVLKERTHYFSDLSEKSGDDEAICSVKIYIAGVDEYKKYIKTGKFIKDNILEIFKVCNYLSDVDTYSIAFKLQDFCGDDLDFSMKVLSVLSTTGYTYQLKKLFQFMINNYGKHAVYDLISNDSCYNELFKLMFFNIM